MFYFQYFGSHFGNFGHAKYFNRSKCDSIVLLVLKNLGLDTKYTFLSSLRRKLWTFQFVYGLDQSGSHFGFSAILNI